MALYPPDRLPAERFRCHPEFAFPFLTCNSAELSHQPPEVLPCRYGRASSSGRCGQRSAYIAGLQALLKRPSGEITVKKSAVEGITCSRCIHGAHANGFHPQDLSVANGQRAIWTKLDYRYSHPASQFPCRCLNCFFTGHGPRFGFIWKRKFKFLQQGRQSGRFEYLGVPPQIR